MQIGSLNIEGKAFLAPMAGIADRAFREICVGFGAAYCVSEMVSIKGIAYGDQKSLALMSLSEVERPIAIQLFGSEPDVLEAAARRVMDFHPDVLDINMGCPTPKIVNNQSGAALMRDPALCADLVRAAKRAVSVPVTVKIRKGWDAQSVNAVEVALRCEEAGADAIAIHGRTRAQMYAPSADWDIIAQVKRAVSVPVIGNGDIFSAEQAAGMLEWTNCDAVMIGRGSLGNPWIFQQINAWLLHNRQIPGPPLSERMRVMLKHVALICRYVGESHGMKEARKHAAWYMKGVHGAAAFRKRCGKLECLSDLEKLAAELLTNCSEQ